VIITLQARARRQPLQRHVDAEHRAFSAMGIGIFDLRRRDAYITFPPAPPTAR
jgi:hypothetical protein